MYKILGPTIQHKAYEILHNREVVQAIVVYYRGSVIARQTTEATSMPELQATKYLRTQLRMLINRVANQMQLTMVKTCVYVQ